MKTVLESAEECGALIESWMTNPKRPALWYFDNQELRAFRAYWLEQAAAICDQEQTDSIPPKSRMALVVAAKAIRAMKEME